MRAPDGRGFIRDGVGEQLRQGRKNTDILSRRLDRQPRIPEPVAASGGIVGVAEIRADAASLTSNGDEKLQEQWVTYGSPTDPTAGTAFPGLDPSTWCTVNTWELVLEEGWYDITVSCEVGWTVANAPTTFYPLIFCQGGGTQLFPNNQPVYHSAVTNSTGTRKGFSAHLAYGPSYVAGDLSFELRWGSYAGGAEALVGVYESSPYLVWTIRKFG